MECKNKFKNIFDEYKNYYECVFDVFYPSKNSTGFTERNLSVNFSKAYEKLNPKAITWFEFQFGEKNNLHYDALIINRETKELFLIESKRFSKLNKKINTLLFFISCSLKTYPYLARDYTLQIKIKTF